MNSRAATVVLMVIATAAVSVLAGWIGLGVALDRLAERGQADLSLSGGRLTNLLQRHREAAVLLADRPDLMALLRAEPDSASLGRSLLQEAADKTGAAGLMLIGRDGAVRATAGDIATPDQIRPALNRAFTGALGSQRMVQGSARRQFVYAAPVFVEGGPAEGALAVAVDAAVIEWNWPADPNAVFFSEPDGRVFVTNRSDLILKPMIGMADGPAVGRVWRVGTHDLLQLDAGRYLPRHALLLQEKVPVIGLNAAVLIDAGPELRVAGWQMAGVAGLGLALSALAFLVLERRRALMGQLEAEEAAKRELEARVAERTGELSAANAELRREVAERQEAEAALRRAQADLVQAGKLSALGKMSAGISHELNQPLMAIRSFADNGEAFLARGNTQKAGENLGRISEMTRRMGRIIKNLRAFARQENEALSDVDLVAVVEAVLELVGGRIRSEGVALGWSPPPHPVIVRGGEVRLQQVVMNLVTNALDAMEGRPDKALDITIAQGPSRAILSICDNGPGIADADRVFDPFYSTKSVGEAGGMGLGLSISYGLVQSFGGAIRGENRDRGGAVFTVELGLAGQEVAA